MPITKRFHDLSSKYISDNYWVRWHQFKKVKETGSSLLNTVVDTLFQVVYGDYPENFHQDFEKLKHFRHRLARNKHHVHYESMGKPEVERLQLVYKRTSLPEAWCQYLQLLAANLKCKKCLEIGTGLGVSGAYILSALKEQTDSSFVTLEDVSKFCEISETQFQKIGPQGRCEILQGPFETTFPKALDLVSNYDLCFMNARLSSEQIINDFMQLKTHAAQPFVFILNNTGANRAVRRAWRQIKHDTEVNFLVDFSQLGVAIIDNTSAYHNCKLKFHLRK